MKKCKFMMLLGFALLIGGTQPLFAQSKKEKKEALAKEVKEQVESGSFTIEVDRALPMSGRAVHLTSSYSLELKDDSVRSYLPYFGRAYSVPYGGGDGLHFSAEMTEKDLKYDKKGNAEIRFQAKTSEDNYSFDVKVFTNGNASIQVRPVNRQSISFNGNLKLEEKDTTSE
ncbi:DUF4251 domain-containing protein [Parabacteroides sp. OttesenSCG-928-J18]|nr:DUF4251 domain-containing protein [Parabacteroides sp. OttesenSCG-928-J18]